VTGDVGHFRPAFSVKKVPALTPQNYIETDSPEPMTGEQYSAWLDWKINH
jgi:hypothetical protein